MGKKEYKSRRQYLSFLGTVGVTGVGSAGVYRSLTEMGLPTQDRIEAMFTYDEKRTPQTILDIDNEDEFSIVVLPDTQYYVNRDKNSTADFKTLVDIIEWITNNQDKYNIKQVLHVGDVCQNPNDMLEWERANLVMSELLNNEIPVLISPGNHDADDMRRWSNYRKTFSYDWYRSLVDNIEHVEKMGTYDGGPENIFYMSNLGGEKFLFLATEYFPREDVMDWAVNIFNNHSEAHAVFLTHGLLNYDGSLGNDTRYFQTSIGDQDDALSGTDMWNRYLSNVENLQFSINGHYWDYLTFNSHKTLLDNNNNPVQLIHHNYQGYDNKSCGGWFRIMTINKKDYTVNSYTYSVQYDKWKKSGDKYFSFEMHEI